jgi:hypothetical protein
MTENKNLVNKNSSLCKFFGSSVTLADVEKLKSILNNPIFTAKIKESLDYYKPRDPAKDITDTSTLYGKPVGPFIKEILSNFSIEYVRYINLEPILREHD